MRAKLLLIAGIVVASSPAGAEAADAPGAVVVSVDCDAGDNLAAGLARAIRRAGGAPYNPRTEARPGPAKPVILDISGSCETNLIVDRDRVTLRGAGGRMALLQSAHDSVPIVDIRYAQDVVLENLDLRNGWIGVRALYSAASIRHSRLQSNTFGVSSETSNVLVVDSVFRNDTYAVASESAGRMELRDCSIEESGFGVVAVSSSTVVIDGGSIRNCFSGITAAAGANVALVDSVEIEFGPSGSGDALLVTQNADVSVTGARVLGQYAWITVERGGTLRTHIDGITTEGPVQAREGGKLFILGGSFTDIWLSDLAVASIRGSSITGTLGCLPSSDAFCSYATIGNVQGCANCPAGGASGAGDEREPVKIDPDREFPDFEDTLREFRRAKSGKQDLERPGPSF